VVNCRIFYHFGLFRPRKNLATMVTKLDDWGDFFISVILENSHNYTQKNRRVWNLTKIWNELLLSDFSHKKFGHPGVNVTIRTVGDIRLFSVK
jgi:hypothetical protein